MEMKYCPVCATGLVEQERFGALRLCCPNHECGFVYFLDPKVVTVVVVEHEGRILLGRRNIEPAKGRWTFLGGYVNRGEKVEEAALREVKEETNLTVTLTGLLGIYSETNNPHILLAYRAAPVNGLAEMQPQEEEVMELRLFAPGEMPPLAFGFDQKILADWQATTL
jgi:ADP-ribose pyrophosphatase YjhB (NUDIX family)